MNEFLIGILDLLKGVFKALGVDYEQLRAIVGIKLTMDNRRQVIAYKRKNSKDPDNTFLWTLFFYALFGSFVALALYGIGSFIIAMMVFFGYVMVMIAMTLITDFSSILLDTSDNTILLPRPVDSRTMFVARVTHISLYLGQLGLGLSIVPAIVVVLKYGWIVLLLFILATILSVIAAVFLTNLLYLLVLQFSSEEKLKNVINYFQIVMAVLIMGGYQLFPRMMRGFDPQEYVFEIQWWSFLIPPIWMAGALDMYYSKTYDLSHFVFALLALVVPLLGFYLVSEYLTPLFSRKLGVIGSGGAQISKPSTDRVPIAIGGDREEGMISRLSGWLTSGSQERSSFELIYHILGRDRKIKLKIYPAFGYVIIFGVVFLFRDKGDFITAWNNLSNTSYHLLLIYLTFMILQVAFHEIPYTDDFKASWIFFSSPLERPGHILSGTLKAIFVRLFIPGYILIGIFVLAVWGIQAIDDVVAGFFNNFLMLLIIATINKRYLPLSMQPSARNQAGTFVRSMILLLLIGAIGFAHYFLSSRPMLLLGAIPIQLVAIYLLLRAYKNSTWDQVTL